MSINLEAIICCKCGIPFGVPDLVAKGYKESGKPFYCPSGHVLEFGNTPLKKAQDEVARLRAEVIALRAGSESCKSPPPTPTKGKCLTRTEYEWSKEEKIRLSKIIHQNPDWTWRKVGEEMGKTGPQCSSMYHNLLRKGQLPEPL